MIVSAHVKGAHNKPLEHESVNRLTRRNGPGHLSSRFLLTRSGRGSPNDPLLFFCVCFFLHNKYTATVCIHTSTL